MISALKMIADRIADCGVARPITLSTPKLGIEGHEHRRDDGEILRDVVGDGEGGQRAAGHQQLLADLHDLDELGRDRCRDRPCCRPRGPPACRCSSPRRRRPGRAPGRRWCRRRTWRPACPCACSSRISASLFSGVASARKSSTPASAAIAAAVSGLSPVIITVRMPIRRNSAKRSRMPPLTMSLRWMTPSSLPSRATTSGVPPDAWRSRRRTARTDSGGRRRRSLSEATASTASTAPLRMDAAVRGRRRSCGSARVNGTNWRIAAAHVAAANAELLLGEHDDRAALRRLVGQRGELRGIRKLLFGDARERHERVACRLPRVMVPVLSSSSMSMSPAASTARPDFARTLNRTSRSMPAMPMAESRPPMVVGISVTNSATSTTTGIRAARVGDESRDRRHRRAGRPASCRPAGCRARSRWASSARLAPSTSAIMRSRKVSPGAAVMRTRTSRRPPGCRRSRPSGRRPPRG